MPRTGKLTYNKPEENDIPKARWLSRWNGIRVYDETKSTEGGRKGGLYVFLYDYNWGADNDGAPMVGRKLGIAPFYDDERGNITWKGRQKAGKSKTGKSYLKWQFDLVGIAPEEGHKLARAITALLESGGLTRGETESKIEAVTKEREDQKLQEAIDTYL